MKTAKLLIPALIGAMMQPTYSQQQQSSPAEDAVDALTQNLADMSDLADQYIELVVASDGVQAALRAEIAALVAGDAALAAKISTAFDNSEATENKMRAGLPGVPPVGGDPLLTSYDTNALFTAAVAAYTGPELVNLDGAQVKAGTTPSIDYFTHSDGSPAGVINTVGPTS